MQPEPGGKGSAPTESKEPSAIDTATETAKSTGPKGSDTAKGPCGGNRVQLSVSQAYRNEESSLPPAVATSVTTHALQVLQHSE
jgi:hypothetical protein